MAFRVSVPAVADKEAVSVLCRAPDELMAITLAEKKIGYIITALPYIVAEVSEEAAERAGVGYGQAMVISPLE